MMHARRHTMFLLPGLLVFEGLQGDEGEKRRTL